MNLLQPFLVALQFLTRIPVSATIAPNTRASGRSILYYPLVGLILGLVLAGLNTLLVDTSATLRAALVLAAWVLLTGALHLDGLADSADAWVGGIGSRQRTLAIMKDPYCGPAAVVTLVVVLLIKFAALHSLDPGRWLALVLIPMLSRALVPALFLTTPYVRRNGVGSAIAEQLPRTAAATVTVLTAAATLLVAGVTGLWLLLTLIGTFILLRAVMLQRLGGTTGDTAGAAIELSEIALLVMLALTPG